MPLIEANSNAKFEQIVSFIKEDRQFDTIRVAEPDLFTYKSSPLV
jgi:hypothetical protein